MQRAWRTLLIAVLLAGFLGPDGCEGMEAPIRTGKTHLTLWFVYNALVTGRTGTAMPSWVDRFSHAELSQLTAFVASLGDQARAGSR